jgi:hypothetical protein
MQADHLAGPLVVAAISFTSRVEVLVAIALDLHTIERREDFLSAMPSNTASITRSASASFA